LGAANDFRSSGIERDRTGDWPTSPFGGGFAESTISRSVAFYARFPKFHGDNPPAFFKGRHPLWMLKKCNMHWPKMANLQVLQ
jgi:hypothetical protein